MAVDDTLVLVLYLLEYLALGIAMYVLGNKLSAENPWMAWIPVLNLWLLVELAELDWWYFLLFLIPGVNLVLFVYCWWRTIDQCEKPPALSLLMLVPGVSVIVALYLAFSK